MSELLPFLLLKSSDWKFCVMSSPEVAGFSRVIGQRPGYFYWLPVAQLSMCLSYPRFHPFKLVFPEVSFSALTRECKLCCHWVGSLLGKGGCTCILILENAFIVFRFSLNPSFKYITSVISNISECLSASVSSNSGSENLLSFPLIWNNVKSLSTRWVSRSRSLTYSFEQSFFLFFS